MSPLSPMFPVCWPAPNAQIWHRSPATVVRVRRIRGGMWRRAFTRENRAARSDATFSVVHAIVLCGQRVWPGRATGWSMPARGAKIGFEPVSQSAGRAAA